MTNHLVRVEADTPVTEAAGIMRQARISSILVTEGGEIQGIFTERDLLFKVDLGDPELPRQTVGEFMSRDLVTATDEAGFAELIGLMRTRGIRHLPITHQGSIAGLVTIRDLLSHHNEYLVDLMEEIIGSLAKAIGEKDPYTAGHQHRVARIACLIAQELGWTGSQIRGLNLAAFVHDIGKLYVPLEILCRPGRLSSNEFNLIQEHPAVGHGILESIEFDWPIAEIVWQHHERLDGTGYPRGLAGDQILAEARVLSVADIFEAVSSHRPYRAALGMGKAVEIIQTSGETQLDPQAVGACLAIAARAPERFTGILDLS
jgi:HD-GYP domain-containing protein (c-di-GMP phosphodiesterase class II)